jgi:apolipoprotein N-acyltransferase
VRTSILLLLAGCASAFGFAPFDLWPCAFLALVLLIAQVLDAARARDALWRGWAFGVGHFLVGDNWVATAFTYQGNMPAWLGWVAVLLMALYLAVYPALAAFLAWKFARRQPLKFAFVFAVTWMLGEWLRSWVFTGFAWDPVGAVWLSLPWVSHAASIVGALGLSALFVLPAGVFWWGLQRSRRAALTAAVTFTLAATLGQWLVHAPPPPSTGAIRIRIVQANIGQDEKYDAALGEKNAKVYAELSGRPTASQRLLLWPEGATLRFPELEPSVRTEFAALLGPHDLLLTGADSATLDMHGHDDVYRNSVFALDSSATLRWRYDKAHLVPFGEYLPARHWLERIGLARLVPSQGDFTAGTRPLSLPLPGFTLHGAPVMVGVQICYEITFPGHVIDAAHRPAFVFNPSNDAWFGSWGPPQHVAQARLRAIEEGLAVIRSTPNGISAIIDPDGNLIATLGIHRQGVIDGFVPEPKPPTVYSRWGAWASALWGLLLLGVGVGASRAFEQATPKYEGQALP